ncbi:hypothetical protein ABZP36_032599 [Zizania latifolia]
MPTAHCRISGSDKQLASASEMALLAPSPSPRVLRVREAAATGLQPSGAPAACSTVASGGGAAGRPLWMWIVERRLRPRGEWEEEGGN